MAQTQLIWQVGDPVVWSRAKSNWSRIGSERVYGVVVAVHPKRIRIRLQTGIKGSLTALVAPDRLSLAKQAP